MEPSPTPAQDAAGSTAEEPQPHYEEEELDTPPALADALPPALPTSPPHIPAPADSGLSAHAPAWMPRHAPHAVSVFNPQDYGTATLRCDLAALTAGELRDYAARQFPMVFAAGDVDMLLNGQPLPRRADAMLIDAGASNGGVIVLRPSAAGTPPPSPPRAAPAPPASSQPPPQQLLQFQHAPGLQQMQPHGVGQAMGQFAVRGPAPGAAAAGALTSALGWAEQPHGVVLPVSRSPPQSPPPHYDGGAAPVPGCSLGTMASNFRQYALTGDGSRFLIQALRTASPADPAQSAAVVGLCREVAAQLPLLATHQHASKVVAAVASVAAPEQQAALLAAACPHIPSLAASNAGSDTVCALLNATSMFDRARGDRADMPLVNAAPMFDRADTRNPATGRPLIVEAILPVIPSLCTQVSGRKLLQAAVAQLPPADAAPLYDAVVSQLTTIATDQCGCITIQRLCDSAPDPALRQRLHAQLMDNAVHLITDPYGNYALQHAVKESQLCSQAVARIVAPRVVDLATNKFASNVIERCLQTGPEDVRELLIPLVAQPAALDVLMQDAFGNYVVQSCIDQAPSHLIDILKENVSPRVPRSPYGYRIDTKLQHRVKRHGRGGGGSRRGGHDRQQMHHAQGFAGGRVQQRVYAGAAQQGAAHAAAPQFLGAPLNYAPQMQMGQMGQMGQMQVPVGQQLVIVQRVPVSPPGSSNAPLQAP